MLTETVLASGMRVWVARPDTAEPRPAVIAMHERYGPIQHNKDLVEWLAADGFVGLAPEVARVQCPGVGVGDEHRPAGDLEGVEGRTVAHV